MLLNLLFARPYIWVATVVAQVVCTFFVLRKMGLPAWNAIVPALSDWRMSTVLFRRRRSFWRPFFVVCCLVAFAFYLNPYHGTGKSTAVMMLMAAIFIYDILLWRLYAQLGKSFGKRRGFGFLAMLLPPVGMAILAFGKATYTPLEHKPIKEHSKPIRILLRTGFVIVSVVEAVAVMAALGYFTLQAYPPRLMGEMILRDTHAATKDVTGTGEVVTREDTMGSAYADLASMPTSREKFYPDHSADQSVVVMAYIVGADLEDRLGCSSANITQMIEASQQGPALTFVLECGGSRRWFTQGIADASYGRYVIHDGTLQKVADLPADTCLSEPDELADFIAWATESYPADRRMLVMWDHGGGLSAGFGMDEVNKRDASVPTLAVSEIADALARAGARLDVIGFDACLMQDIEIASALEPYADWYLASEETEGGFGWCWSWAFGLLAQDPGMPSEDFGREMTASYDPYNRALNDGKQQEELTLSFVDLPRAKAAYRQMEGLFGSAHQAMLDESANYASLSLSGSKAYTFGNKEQVDLEDFITRLGQLDFDNQILSDDERESLLQAVRACVVYRNGDSAEGINGMAFTFPCTQPASYTYDHNQMKSLSMDAERSLYDDFFSIMAAQQLKSLGAAVSEGDFMGALQYVSDLSGQDWYVEGFEDYETQEALVDIPLTEVDDGYRIELPEKAWGIIAEQQLIAYQKTDDALLRYLGRDDIGAEGADGHPLVAMGGDWVHVGGQLVCYESGPTRETDEGIIFTGTTKALLNGERTVELQIEWDPVTDVSDAPAWGHVTGYREVQEDNPLLALLGEDVLQGIGARSQENLSPGDRLQFLFDCYDEQGELVRTETFGRTVRVSSMERLSVEDAPLGECDVVFGGVLTDVYQRVMTTEKIEAHVG